MIYILISDWFQAKAVWLGEEAYPKYISPPSASRLDEYLEDYVIETGHRGSKSSSPEADNPGKSSFGPNNNDSSGTDSYQLALKTLNNKTVSMFRPQQPSTGCILPPSSSEASERRPQPAQLLPGKLSSCHSCYNTILMTIHPRTRPRRRRLLRSPRQPTSPRLSPPCPR